MKNGGNTSVNVVTPWTAEARWLRWLTVIWAALGTVMIFSASFAEAGRSLGNGFYFIVRHGIWLGIGIPMFLILTGIPLRVWANLGRFLYPLGLALLLLTYLPGLGVEKLDATRWLSLGPLTIQPSELLKPLMVMQAAVLFGRWWQHSPAYRWGWIMALILGLLAILEQPNLGTTVVCALSLWGMAWLAGLPQALLWTTAGVGVVGAMASLARNEYQRRRITGFLNPWASPQDEGYQLIQSLLAIGSGRLWGVGFGLSQQKLSYLPIQYTDFIFAVYAEEFGLAGSLAFLLLLAVYTAVGLRVIGQTTNGVARLMAGGCVLFLVGQSLINIAVVTGSLPTTGVPLPLFSYGGSSWLASLALAALLIRAAREMGEQGVTVEHTRPLKSAH
ncbi:MAG: putative peptidoglycan glycosyltransferase FtsW [Synechococcales cyanobacterium]